MAALLKNCRTLLSRTSTIVLREAPKTLAVAPQRHLHIQQTNHSTNLYLIKVSTEFYNTFFISITNLFLIRTRIEISLPLLQLN